MQNHKCVLPFYSLLLFIIQYNFDGQARGLMPKTLDLLAQKGQFHLPIELQSKLASRGFTEIISKSANGKHVPKLALIKGILEHPIYCVNFACTMLIF